MSNSKRRRTMYDDDERDQAERKAGRRIRLRDDAEAKAADSRRPKERLRGRSIRIVRKGHPDDAREDGRRPEPTRYDAMPIAGHKRLPGYETPPARDEPSRDDESRSLDAADARKRRSERDDES